MQDEQEFNQEVEEEVFFEEETPVEEPQGEDTDWKAEAEKAKAEALKYKAILERKQKKEAQPEEAKTDKPISNESQYLTREEAVLIAKGFDDEHLAHAKKIAKGAGISLLDAVNDPLFIAFEEKQKEEKRKQKAQLNASNSSGRTPKGKPIGEMTREENEAYWRDRIGQ